MGCGSSSEGNSKAVKPEVKEEAKPQVITPSSPPPQSASAAAPDDGPRRLHVVHFNDVYNLEPTSKDPESYGGAARFASKLKELRTADPKIMTVFGGDLFGPSMTSGLTKGKHMVDVLNDLKIDYGCFGNHEYDFGMKGLNKALHDEDGHAAKSMAKYGITIEPSTTTWISTNIDGADGKPIGGSKKSVLVDWHGVKVGLISVSENWLPGCAKVKAVEAIWLNDVDEATKACKELRAGGAEVILALTHSGIEADKVFMKQIGPDLLDLCCGGHDHDYIREESLRIVKAGQEWRWLSEIVFELPPKGQAGAPKLIKCEKVIITQSIEPDHHIGDLIAKWDAFVAEKSKKVIGTSHVPLDSTEAALRWKEGHLSNWVADVIASDFSADEGAQAADFSMMMGFTIAGKVITPAGDITYGELLSWFPTNETVVVIKLTGTEVMKSLERGCGGLPNECGSIHHVSSKLSYEIDISIPKGKGRAKNVLFNGAPIDPDQTFTVAVSSAMAQGKYGYDWMGKAPRVVDEEFATPFLDLLRDWLKANKTLPIDLPGEGNRIKIY